MQLSWYGGKGELCVVTEEGAVILNESIMSCYMTGELAVVQISTNEISINLGGPQDNEIINTDIQIRGLSVAKSCFIVWNGKYARIYRIDLQMQKYEALDAIRCTSNTMMIADSNSISDEAWFYVENNTIKINNFAGTTKGLLSFSEAEGAPEFLDLNGRYLAVVTSKGFLLFLIIIVFDLFLVFYLFIFYNIN
jgi:hypothetical protein